jgi:hypothetical protein
VIRAIAMHIGTLRDEKTSAADKAQALKFLGHFVGDIHQSLHVGCAEDKGGNTIRVRFIGKETSLHAVWDGGLIASLGSIGGRWRTGSTRASSMLNGSRARDRTCMTGWRSLTGWR